MTNTDSDKRNKVASLIEAYELHGVGDELESAWTATGEHHRSLRALADEFNCALLERRLTEAGVQTVDGEVENMYRLLTDDDTAEGDRVRLERRLERDGLDTEALRGEFVSYQTVRRYLTNVRGAEYERPEGDRLEKEAENLNRLRGRTESVTQTKLEQLRGSDLTLGEFRASVDIRIFCEECESQYDLETLFDRGACDCS